MTANFSEEDLQIFLHRDAHFHGDFAEMYDYYQKGGIGVINEIEPARISELARVEEIQGSNLAFSLYSDKDREDIQSAKKMYEYFQKMAHQKTAKNPQAALIARLILSEEEEPTSEIEAIVQEKGAVVPALIALLKNEDLYNPLFPGYGHAPHRAAHCLGLIKDKRAIISLFESIGKGDFFDDEILLNALKAIGDPAKEFLLNVLKGKPFNEDNDRAAIALMVFKDDREVAVQAFKLLQTVDLKHEAYFATYLILLSESLKGTPLEKSFVQFAASKELSKDLQNDCQTILKSWQNSPEN